MVKALLQIALAVVLLALPMALLPVDTGMWRQQLTIRANVTLALPTSTPTPAADLVASVEIQPKSLNLGDRGKPVEAIVELPVRCDAREVDLDSVRICTGTSACGSDGVQPMDKATVDGTGRLHLTFDRQAVIAMVVESGATDSVTFTVSGVVNSPEQHFTGSDRIKLEGTAPVEVMAPVLTGTPAPSTATGTATVTPTTASTPSAQLVTVTPNGTPSVTPTSSATAITPVATAESTGGDTSPAAPTAPATPVTPTVNPASSPVATPTVIPTATAAPTATIAPTVPPTATAATTPPTPTTAPAATTTPIQNATGGRATPNQALSGSDPSGTTQGTNNTGSSGSIQGTAPLTR